MMTIIKDQTFDKRTRNSTAFTIHSSSTAPSTALPTAKSALKECRNVRVEDSFFDLRYSLWHDHSLVLKNCALTEKLPRRPLVRRGRQCHRHEAPRHQRPFANAERQPQKLRQSSPTKFGMVHRTT